MAKMTKRDQSAGKVGYPTDLSGQKNRSPTSDPHMGSRVEPSHMKGQQKGGKVKGSGRTQGKA